MFGIAKKIRAAGVIGVNQRNADYILKYNSRRFYPLVDDKIRTKLLAKKFGIAVPELYAAIEIQRQINDLPKLLSLHDDFVIKPAHGSQGEGITVITGQTRGYFRKSDGSLVASEDLKFQVSNILSGIYSLGGQPDKAIIEYRVKFDPIFEHISYRGVPDVRIIIFMGVPVMAMVRLPTQESGGKANLHQGCIGAGVDIATGQTLHAVWKNSVVQDHPDTGHQVAGLVIPHWDQLLDIAARSYEMTGLGYQGVDLVMDQKFGPLLLELNARPGLNIQIANREGLSPRLIKIQEKQFSSVRERVAFARENFRSIYV